MNATKPTTPCRCCGNELRTEFQPGYKTTPGRWQVTCDKEGCGLRGYTFGAAVYQDVKIENYVKG